MSVDDERTSKSPETLRSLGSFPSGIEVELLW